MMVWGLLTEWRDLRGNGVQITSTSPTLLPPEDFLLRYIQNSRLDRLRRKCISAYRLFIPTIPPLSPPMPVYVEYVEGDLDRSVVIIPSIAVLTIFTWMLWMFFKRRRNLQMMHIDFIDEDYDGALDEFDSSSSDDDSDNEGSANTGSGGGIFGFGRQRPEVEERYNRSQRIRALEERLQQTQTQ